MNVATYLDRIGYTGPTAPTLETLRGLHQAHLLCVPFENLDIHVGRRIVLDPDRLFDKIVTRRRGGFCYELNGLFAELLLALGFDVSRLAARVWGGDGYGVEFDHLTLLVKLGDHYLADVGFGDAFRYPLRFDDAVKQAQPFGVYRLVKENGRWRYDRHYEKTGWQPEYMFALTPYALADFNGGCDYNQTSPQSIFTHKRVCTRATPDGRITLRDTRLIVTANGTKQELPIAGEDEYRTILAERFGMVIAQGA